MHVSVDCQSRFITAEATSRDVSFGMDRRHPHGKVTIELPLGLTEDARIAIGMQALTAAIAACDADARALALAFPPRSG